jgi:peptidoglycan/xylan/chitin deacetylase (PgdA/CDA1 family)
MYLAKTPTLFYKLYNSKDLWRVRTSEDIIYLTFDDGPVPEITPWVLDMLDTFEAKATFFCVGENVKKNPDIFEDIIRRKHSVGNHTYSHMNGWKSNPEDYFYNVHKCEDHFYTSLFRPPYGKVSLSQHKLLKKQFNLVYWTVLSGDFDQRKTPEKCLQKVKTSVEKGSIVVFHDSIKAWNNLLYTLPPFLNYFHKKGFRFKALPYNLNELSKPKRAKIVSLS